eukprot:2131389-Pyramimonas_sp.AAC.1
MSCILYDEYAIEPAGSHRCCVHGLAARIIVKRAWRKGSPALTPTMFLWCCLRFCSGLGAGVGVRVGAGPGPVLSFLAAADLDACTMRFRRLVAGAGG